MTSQRLPAYPLIACDPGFSIWMRSDLLTDAWPTHWTGMIRGSCIMARVDGLAYAVMGPCCGRKAEQRARQVLPTSTIYVLQAGAVELTVTFLNPLLPDDLDVLSRPLAYVIVAARATDGGEHAVQLYLDVGGEWATDTPDQEVVWSRPRVKGLDCMKIGTASQRVLARAGDNLRTDWGHCWLAVAADGRQQGAVQSDPLMRAGWIAAGRLPDEDDQQMPRPAHANHPKMGAAIDLGRVGSVAVEGTFIVAYEDIWALEFMQRRIRPYWQRGGQDFASMLKDAVARQGELRRRCAAFDAELLARCEAAGGAAYRDLCAASYRQAVAAHKLGADFDGSPLFFSKENFSNGCIATVDVTYPSAPLFLLVNPVLLEGMVTPVLQYAASPRWRFPFAPHDLGTFPLANGQVYGGGESTERDQMPVEECGNMLLLVAAICQAHGSPQYAVGYWRQVAQWTGYLIDKGLDPDNQLCTDDFAGHLAHNTNLSIKAILGIGAAAKLAGQLGRAEAAIWRSAAERMATQWLGMARDACHYRLTFDGAGSWSQKYNLVWDRLLGLGLFPAEVARTEVASYLKRLNRYGLPLDSRRTYTKNDWTVWSATLAERREDFTALIAPILTWLAEAPDRQPLTDWYDTVSGKQEGFQARSVVGGFFLPALAASPAFSRPAG